jgi:hypothetical protein
MSFILHSAVFSSYLEIEALAVVAPFGNLSYGVLSNNVPLFNQIYSFGLQKQLDGVLGWYCEGHSQRTFGTHF